MLSASVALEPAGPGRSTSVRWISGLVPCARPTSPKLFVEKVLRDREVAGRAVAHALERLLLGRGARPGGRRAWSTIGVDGLVDAP